MGQHQLGPVAVLNLGGMHDDGQELKLDGEEVSMVQGKLAYLAQAARRQGSRDWMYTAVGLCATTAMSLALSRDAVAALWQLLQDEVGRLVHLMPGAHVALLSGQRA